MTITYQIDASDFLTHQLYIASKSERIKKKRRNSKLIISLMYIVFGLVAIYTDNLSLGIIFVIFGLLWFFTYPLWQRRHYVNHYKSFIKENYKDRINRAGTLELTDEVIIAKDQGSESRILTTELEGIEEIPSTIFIKLKAGQWIILPKDKISDIENLTERLKKLAKYLNVKYKVDDKWEWK